MARARCESACGRLGLRGFVVILVALLSLGPVAPDVLAGEPEQLWEQSEKAWNDGDPEEALKTLYRLLGLPGLNPGLAGRAYGFQGGIQLHLGRQTDARESFRRGLQTDPSLRELPIKFSPRVQKVFDEIRVQAEVRRQEEERKAMLGAARVPRSPNPFAVWRDPTAGADFVFLPGGCFQMGCSRRDRDCEPDEHPAHEVCVAPFWIGRSEVTQKQWQLLMGENPSLNPGEANPVEKLSWEEAKAFVEKLSRPDKIYRLPTEAEWEYAARGGGEHLYAGDDDPDLVAWYSDNSGSHSHPGGGRKPNTYGLLDLSGNVGEWCEDWYQESYYAQGHRDNPVNRVADSYRVVRGGNWLSDRVLLRVGNRGWAPPSSHLGHIGFRLVLEPAASQGEGD